MTDEEHRKLNVQVGEAVFGLSFRKSCPSCEHPFDCTVPGVDQCDKCFRDLADIVPDPYSTDIAAAFDVVPVVSKQRADSFGMFETEGWEAGWGEFIPYEGWCFDVAATAATAPLAICLAALKAVS